VLPPDYLETGRARQIIPSMALDDVTRAPLFTLLFDAVRDSGSADVLNRIQQPTTLTQVNLSPEARTDTTLDEDANFALVYVAALLFIITILTSSTYLMQSVIEEKENRMIEVLITTVRPSQLLTGKILAMGVLALTQIAIWILIGVVLFQFQGDFFKQAAPFILNMLQIPLEPIPWIALFYLLGFFMYAAVFGAIGALSNSMQEGPQLSIFIILPTMIPLWAAPALVADPNGSLAVLLSVIPFTAPLTLSMRLVLTSVPLEQLLLSAGIMAVTLLALYWLAGRLFRVQTLLSGKAPKIRELPRLLFGRS
jgi:ABC-2 type transport system permease protein